MLRKFLPVACMVIWMLPAGFASARNDDKINSDPTKAEFVQLFNGKDLTGWEGDPAFWSVKDGLIVAQVSAEVHVKNHSYLIWQGGKVRDFELQVTLRSTQGNSGIDYRAEPVHTDREGNQLKWTIQGYQSDIAKGWMGSLYNWGKPGAQPGQFVVVEGDETVTTRIGSVADKEILSKLGYYKPGQWNEFMIIARGSHILHKINGYPVIEFIDNSRDARREGVLGLQVHSGRGPFLNEFKDIRIRHFNVNFGQAESLFNGKNLSGWVFSNAEVRSAWMVKNGVLVNKDNTQGYICTKDDYTSYVLRFQYRRLGTPAFLRKQEGVLLRLSDSEQTQPKYIRVYGKGDDFNQVKGTNFALKVHKRRSGAVPFRRMPQQLWNECEIVLNKGQLEVKVNDILRAEATDCEQTPGKIGFEGGGSHIEYRNIVLIPILSN